MVFKKTDTLILIKLTIVYRKVEEVFFIEELERSIHKEEEKTIVSIQEVISVEH